MSPRPLHRRAGRLDVARRLARGNRRLVARIPEVKERPVAELGVFLQRLDPLVAARIPDKRQANALREERPHRLANERQVRRRRHEIPVLATVLRRQFAENRRQLGNRLVDALSAPAPRRVLAVEALHRAPGEEYAAAAALARERRLLAEVRTPAKDARRVARAAIADLAVPARRRAPPRTKLALTREHNASFRAAADWRHRDRQCHATRRRSSLRRLQARRPVTAGTRESSGDRRD